MSHPEIHAYRDGLIWPDRDFKLPSGQHTAGNAIGILLLDDFYWPFMPGDMANASTFEFQVQHKIVTSSTLKAVKQADPKVGRALIKAAQALQSQGVRAIVGGCGFFGYFQTQVAAAVNVPVTLSALEQIAWVRRTLKPEQKIAVFSDVNSLTPELFAACGTPDTSDIVPAHTSGLPETVRQRSWAASIHTGMPNRSPNWRMTFWRTIRISALSSPNTRNSQPSLGQCSTKSMCRSTTAQP